MIRRLVSVFQLQGSQLKKADKVKPCPMPHVFSTPIRPDIVQFVHTNINRNKIQGHAVQYNAGMKHSAQSWGTGRAVARIPRVSGSGTHRSGQGAFGNMCRKGRMFAPIRIWRKWHRRVNIRQKRYAVGSAIAASAVAPLVQARGHLIDKLPQIPFVITDNSINKLQKTKQALKFLSSIRALTDVKKVSDKKRIRAGRAKSRNRRYKTRKGPLIVYQGQNLRFLKAFRGIQGIDFCNVNRLNLLQLAPGGHFGRFIIWTQTAFRALSTIFSSKGKHDYQLPRSVISNPDVTRLIKNASVQEKLRAPKKTFHLHSKQRGNPLNCQKRMQVLNPYDKVRKDQLKAQQNIRRQARLKAIKQSRSMLTEQQKKERKINRSNSRKRFVELQQGLKGVFKETIQKFKETKRLQSVQKYQFDIIILFNFFTMPLFQTLIFFIFYYLIVLEITILLIKLFRSIELSFQFQLYSIAFGLV